MSPTDSAPTPARFGEAEDGPRKKKFSACACLAFVIASICGIVLLLLVLPNVLMTFLEPRAKALIDILKIKTALESYAQGHDGKFPDSLDVLVETGSNERQLIGSRDALRDPWGRQYLYEPPSPEHAEPRVFSYGRDGEPGGEGEDADLDSLKVRAER
jgi:type II secretory pathway pseudopilin PulG